MTDVASVAQYPHVALVQPAPATDDAAPAADFRAIYRAELPYVWRTMRRLGARPADVEDLVHDVFVVVHRRLSDYDPARPIRPWLFGIAFRVASDYRRRARFRREVVTDDIDRPAPDIPADARMAAAEDRALVIEALAALDLDRRAVLVLHDIDGYAAPEIADTLGVKLNTVYSRLRVARKRFEQAVRRLQARKGAGR